MNNELGNHETKLGNIKHELGNHETKIIEMKIAVANETKAVSKTPSVTGSSRNVRSKNLPSHL